MQGIYAYIPGTNYVPREYKCCSYSVVTIHGAYIVSFSVESIEFLHKYFMKYVCSAQYGCFSLLLLLLLTAKGLHPVAA